MSKNYKVDRCIINDGKEDQLLCSGYLRSAWKLILVGTLIILSGGLVLLVLYWKKNWRLKSTHKKCQLWEATAVLLKDDYNVEHAAYIEEDQLNAKTFSHILNDESSMTYLIAEKQIRQFFFQKMRYIWISEQGKFVKISGLGENFKTQELLAKNQCESGLTVEEQKNRSLLFGANEIKINVKSIPLMLVQEVLHPFYVFQLFSVIVWSIDEYYSYVICIVLMSALAIGFSLYLTRQQHLRLKEMSESSTVVTVRRKNGDEVEIAEKFLVPGDLIIIPKYGCTMPCDAALICGSCIVNESMLTGESVPVTKTALENESESTVYSPEQKHKLHTLFCGTQVIQTRYYSNESVVAVVTRTGYSTLKGELVRSILYPKPVSIKLYRDALAFVGVMAFVAMGSFIYSATIQTLRGNSIRVILLKALDTITIAVPPALPTALTVGIAYAQNRLKRKQIFCISPQKINLSGMLDVVCFDKTGTLTENGLAFYGVVLSENERLEKLNSSASGHLEIAMASCHSLAHIDEKIVGDPLDMSMFEATNWILEESSMSSKSSDYDSISPTIVYKQLSGERIIELGILKQFPFTSSLQRMSVIARQLNLSNMNVYVKGAPETIVSLCMNETVPFNFEPVLKTYTKEGFRVLALAYKPLDKNLSWHKAMKISRDEFECNLIFLGFMVLQNKLKPETCGALFELDKANIRTLMVTGDNILTAVHVAKTCGIITKGANVAQPEMRKSKDVTGRTSDHLTWSYLEKKSESDFEPEDDETLKIMIEEKSDQLLDTIVIDGDTFRVVKQDYPEFFQKVVKYGAVFARMSPSQKDQLVEALQRINYNVGMCGDGANDIQALKSAHSGISLSETEASVAAPFTSRVQNITCVPTVIKEGRASLVTSFSIFKYMALYSIIQLVTVMILYWAQTNLSDWQFTYIDVFIITSIILFMGRSEAHKKISQKKPTLSFLSKPVIVSLIIQIVLQIGFQCITYVLLLNMPWFEPLVPQEDYEDNLLCYEATALFMVSSFQYITVALVFSTGRPYTKRFYHNRIYCIVLFILTSFTTFIVLAPFEFLENWLTLKRFPEYSFRIVILGIALVDFVVSIIVEHCILRKVLVNYLEPESYRQEEELILEFEPAKQN